ncbi:MAG: hypothetical protein HC777_03990 [Hyphomonadaceae bacterium]|nr:hypothetical protein [Hyphomonadaceae bacterium]
MTPIFEIILESEGGKDLTALIADRLISMTITDEVELSSDRLEIVLDDRDMALAVPAHGATLAVSLAAQKGQAMTPVGRFVVNSVSLSGPNRTLTIEGNAADLADTKATGLRSAKTRNHGNITLGALTRKIASEHGMKAAIAPDLARVAFTRLAQRAESDLHLITRLARGVDAIAKPVDGVLTVVAKGAVTTASGRDMPAVKVAVDQASNWQWRTTDRDRDRSVSVRWRDTKAGRTHVIVLGAGEPKRDLRRLYASEAEARAAGEAVLKQGGRGQSLELSIAGFGAGLFAGGLMALSDAHPRVDGQWHLKRVEHRLTGALTTSSER